LQADLLAFFGVELHCVAAVFPDHAGKWLPVNRLSSNHSAVIRLHHERVIKIKIAAVGYAVEKCAVLAANINLVPAYLRYFYARRREPANAPAQMAEAIVDAVLVTFIKECLQAKTDTEERAIIGKPLLNRAPETVLVQVRHAVAKCALPWHDQVIQTLLKIIAAANAPHFSARLLQCLLHTAQVAHPVIHQSDHVTIMRGFRIFLKVFFWEAQVHTKNSLKYGVL